MKKTKAKRRRRCSSCKMLKPDVRNRPDSYRQDVGNKKTAMWVACDSCDHENLMDI